MKLLHIDSSVQGENSVSRALSAAVAARLRGEIGGLETIYRDLAADPLPHMTLAGLPSAHPLSTDGIAADAVLAEFKAADVVVIGVPMYNFGIPSQLKAWLDRLAAPGVTFTYDANGPQGLAGDKRVILALSRGGLYSAGSAGEAAEHAERYLRTFLGFIGIVPEIVVAEGVAMGPDARRAALDGALGEAALLAA